MESRAAQAIKVRVLSTPGMGPRELGGPEELGERPRAGLQQPELSATAASAARRVSVTGPSRRGHMRLDEPYEVAPWLCYRAADAGR